MVSRLRPALPGLRGMLLTAIGLPIARDLAIRAQPGNRSELALMAYLLLLTATVVFVVANSLSREEIGIVRLRRGSLALGLGAGAVLLVQPLATHQVRPVISLAMLWVVLAVAVEEFAFRGALYAALQRMGGAWLALAGSTAAFTLAHLVADPNPSLLLVLVLGLYLGILRLLSLSLWAPTLAHLLLDLASFA